MENNAKSIADYLLQIKAIKLQPSNPFTWASGWKSPIYCDNRKTLSFPGVRLAIRDAFIEKIKEIYPDAELIAGVATGAIAHGVLVADALGLPFVYVRSGAKEHGLGNRIEGYYEKNQKVVVIEDLISTGGSSLRAVNALRKEGCSVLGMIAIFTYGFKKAEDNFRDNNCSLFTLCDYNALLEQANTTGYIDDNEIDTLERWRQDPSSWGK
ncbi:MAG TPA: orotate phosphoribosyltransferase [Bacteroidales bacterium]|nr:orotate phosphoribosyltransferase [Bacteroidales bacterium]